MKKANVIGAFRSDEMQDLLADKGLKSNSDIEFDWEDEDDLAEMFPTLWEHFGEEPLGY
ncbi:molybdate metabolism regulator [Neobacillus novalis]|uniref:Molybdate metabolism regulator n=1 Tax=Neobacillus novalis TaxID=220687 RepID=A0AA95MPK4_9BACI|nr:molybdate metabolism regulator [Neobacillus novalis]WHY87092.1 molybdate metabolism regulator [Neobacillus novalis]